MEQVHKTFSFLSNAASMRERRLVFMAPEAPNPEQQRALDALRGKTDLLEGKLTTRSALMARDAEIVKLKANDPATRTEYTNIIKGLPKKEQEKAVEKLNTAMKNVGSELAFVKNGEEYVMKTEGERGVDKIKEIYKTGKDLYDKTSKEIKKIKKTTDDIGKKFDDAKEAVKRFMEPWMNDPALNEVNLKRLEAALKEPEGRESDFNAIYVVLEGKNQQAAMRYMNKNIKRGWRLDPVVNDRGSNALKLVNIAEEERKLVEKFTGKLRDISRREMKNDLSVGGRDISYVATVLVAERDQVLKDMRLNLKDEAIARAITGAGYTLEAGKIVHSEDPASIEKKVAPIARKLEDLSKTLPLEKKETDEIRSILARSPLLILIRDKQGTPWTTTLSGLIEGAARWKPQHTLSLKAGKFVLEKTPDKPFDESEFRKKLDADASLQNALKNPKDRASTGTFDNYLNNKLKNKQEVDAFLKYVNEKIAKGWKVNKDGELIKDTTTKSPEKPVEDRVIDALNGPVKKAIDAGSLGDVDRELEKLDVDMTLMVPHLAKIKPVLDNLNKTLKLKTKGAPKEIKMQPDLSLRVLEADKEEVKPPEKPLEDRVIDALKGPVKKAIQSGSLGDIDRELEKLDTDMTQMVPHLDKIKPVLVDLNKILKPKTKGAPKEIKMQPDLSLRVLEADKEEAFDEKKFREGLDGNGRLQAALKKPEDGLSASYIEGKYASFTPDEQTAYIKYVNEKLPTSWKLEKTGTSVTLKNVEKKSTPEKEKPMTQAEANETLNNTDPGYFNIAELKTPKDFKEFTESLMAVVKANDIPMPLVNEWLKTKGLKYDEKKKIVEKIDGSRSTEPEKKLPKEAETKIDDLKKEVEKVKEKPTDKQLEDWNKILEALKKELGALGDRWRNQPNIKGLLEALGKLKPPLDIKKEGTKPDETKFVIEKKESVPVTQEIKPADWDPIIKQLKADLTKTDTGTLNRLVDELNKYYIALKAQDARTPGKLMPRFLEECKMKKAPSKVVVENDKLVLKPKDFSEKFDEAETLGEKIKVLLMEFFKGAFTAKFEQFKMQKEFQKAQEETQLLNSEIERRQRELQEGRGRGTGGKEEDDPELRRLKERQEAAAKTELQLLLEFALKNGIKEVKKLSDTQFSMLIPDKGIREKMKKFIQEELIEKAGKKDVKVEEKGEQLTVTVPASPQPGPRGTGEGEPGKGTGTPERPGTDPEKRPGGPPKREGPGGVPPAPIRGGGTGEKGGGPVETGADKAKDKRIEDLDAEVGRLKREVIDARNKQLDAEAATKRAEQEAKLDRTARERADQERDAAIRRANEQQNRADGLQKQVEQANKNVEDIKKELGAKDKDLAKLSDDIKDLRSDLKKIQSTPPITINQTQTNIQTQGGGQPAPEKPAPVVPPVVEQPKVQPFVPPMPNEVKEPRKKIAPPPGTSGSPYGFEQ